MNRTLRHREAGRRQLGPGQGARKLKKSHTTQGSRRHRRSLRRRKTP